MEVSWNTRLVQECKLMPDVSGLTEDEEEEVGDGQTEEVSVGDWAHARVLLDDVTGAQVAQDTSDEDDGVDECEKHACAETSSPRSERLLQKFIIRHPFRFRYDTILWRHHKSYRWWLAEKQKADVVLSWTQSKVNQVF